MIGRKYGATLLLLATAAAAPDARGPEALKTAMLRAHATARAAVGVRPLAWDDRLEASARAHAEEMARTGRYFHAVQAMDRNRQGENMWMGQRGAYSFDEMAETWLAERRDFVDQPAPAFSRSGRWQDAAHYAQVVWRGTTTLGCAVASSATDDYLVCRYAAPGNVLGQRAY